MRAAALLLALLPAWAEAGELAGHGGPVMALVTDPATDRLASAGFDNAVGLWTRGVPRWFDGHSAAATAVVFADAGHIVSGGDDLAVLEWDLASGEARTLGAHLGKVRALAVSPDGAAVASAGWDGAIGLWPRRGGAPLMLTGHASGVNEVAFGPAGTLYSASMDGTIRLRNIAGARQVRTVVDNGFGINRLHLGDGWLAYGAVDGTTRVIDPATGAVLADVTPGRRPILALAADPAGQWLAVGDGEEFVMILDTATWQVVRDFRAMARGPVWALAFSADGGTLFAGGIGSAILSFPMDADPPEPAAATPAFLRPPGDMPNGERQFARKCSRYIPGTKMPMQRIADPQDRADLVSYLARATRN